MKTVVQKERTPLWADPRLVWGAIGILVVLGLYRRVFEGFVPGDFTAYLSAADVFVSGADPYSDALTQSRYYDGFPYVYLPGTLFLIAPAGYLPGTLVVALEWIARFAALFGILKILQRRIVPQMPLAVVALIALLHEPLWIDHLVGNLVIYLMAAWAICLELSEREESWRVLALAFLCGAMIAFKPFWLIPAGWLLFSRAKYRASASLVLGMVAVLSLSFALPQFWTSYWDLNEQMRAFYYSVNLLNVAPALYFVLFPAAVFGALWFSRRYPSRWLFVLGCVSMPVWPRLASYSYALTLPWTLYLIRRWGYARGLAFSAVTVGPLPWILRDSTLLVDGRLEAWTLLLWTSVSAVVCCYLLMKESKSQALEFAAVELA